MKNIISNIPIILLTLLTIKGGILGFSQTQTGVILTLAICHFGLRFLDDIKTKDGLKEEIEKSNQRITKLEEEIKEFITFKSSMSLNNRR